jgi:hypothetical protein
MVDPAQRDWVGPVLQRGPLTDAVVECLLEANPGAVLVDRGAYLRVLAPGACVLPRAAVERKTGRPFRLPVDLELMMSAFKGRLSVTEDAATWALGVDGR